MQIQVLSKAPDQAGLASEYLQYPVESVHTTQIFGQSAIGTQQSRRIDVQGILAVKSVRRVLVLTGPDSEFADNRSQSVFRR